MLPSDFSNHPLGKDFHVRRFFGPDFYCIVTHIPSGLWMECSKDCLSPSEVISKLLCEYDRQRDGKARPTSMTESRSAIARAVG